MGDDKKRRFFGDGDAFGDGGAWVHIGDTADDVLAPTISSLRGAFSFSGVNEIAGMESV